MTIGSADIARAPARPARVIHPAWVRITHWINAVALFVMITSGWRVYNASPLFRFEFPERPGALLRFLEAVGTRWNISLFHYRNHGADYGRILVGLQVPPKEMKVFRGFLKTLGYRYWEETDNLAYKLFLK